MTWVKLDDNFPGNDKVLAIGADAFRLYVEGLCHSARHLTDGFVSNGALSRLWTPSIAPELVTAGLWAVVDGGYVINDYLEFNPSREKVETEREKAAERKAKWAERRSERVANGVRNASRDAGGTLPRPDPTRPEGIGVGESVETEALPSPEIVKAQVPKVREIRGLLKAVGE